MAEVYELRERCRVADALLERMSKPTIELRVRMMLDSITDALSRKFPAHGPGSIPPNVLAVDGRVEDGTDLRQRQYHDDPHSQDRIMGVIFDATPGSPRKRGNLSAHYAAFSDINEAAVKYIDKYSHEDNIKYFTFVHSLYQDRIWML
ncbi:hypothetical protein EIP91_011019 [Steccherinum ochraceum]|uniref:Uncharacterized protein n=1 Tax=Steccherinum ochraceum TaxID=92696 RepID=A0A4R0R574_9APHY|nr:hypothetical protein EIP91_011019 [Steccherinum ochraceum]